jgi:hypothetical protein
MTDSLEDRVAALERAGTYRIKLSAADLLRLQPQDVVVLRTSRSLADSETARLAVGWRELMNSVHMESVQLLVLAGADCTLEVIRKDQTAA